MKRMLSKYLFILLMAPAFAFAGGKYEKEKKINKSYNVSSNATLALNNKYGNVDIQTWGEDRITIDVVIRISGNNEKDVNNRLNSINVEFDVTAARVSAKTIFGKFSGKTSRMQIDYVVKIPNRGGLDLHNQYGNINITKVSGPTKINVDYGDVLVEELNNASNELDISYSHGSKIGTVKAAAIDAQYSTLSIANAGSLQIDGQYSNLAVGEVETVSYDMDYGKLSVHSAGKVSGKGNYVEIAFGTIDNILNVTAKYGKVAIANFGRSSKNVAINSTYTSIYIPGGSDAAYDFEFQLQYANINGGSGFKYTERDVKGSSGKYKGYYNRSGGTRLYIDSEYGNIHVGTSPSNAPKVPKAPKAPTPGQR